MSPTVEAGARPQVHLVVLELGSDGSREGAGLVQGDGDDVLLALDDGLGHGALGSEVAGLAVGDESVGVAHEEESPEVVDPVESGDLGAGIPLEEDHHEVVIHIEPPLRGDFQIPRLGVLAPAHFYVLIGGGQVLVHVFLVLERVGLGLV